MLLADGGLETTLVFHQGLDLPDFAAFPLLGTESGRAALAAYWAPYVALVAEHGVSFAVDTPTWRANPDWGARLGYDAAALAEVDAGAARFARSVAEEMVGAIVVGLLGPRGDGYVAGQQMSPDEAADYHRPQVRALADAGVDRLALLTVTYADEAVGFVRAAGETGVPATVGFTVETDGRVPDGQSLRASVEQVDHETGSAAAGFMVNCAHPTHVEPALEDGPWLLRITGLRANASTLSHAELDEAETLDAGDPADLAERYVRLRERLPALELVGGCCGTDLRHVRAISEALLLA